MNDVLERRLRRCRSRLVVRSWEYRQRQHARGVWFRLRRVLADAVAAYLVSPEHARELIAEGHRPEPVGSELQPSKVILFVSAERVRRIAGARRVPVRLTAELLLASHLALVPFDGLAEVARASPERV